MEPCTTEACATVCRHGSLEHNRPYLAKWKVVSPKKYPDTSLYRLLLFMLPLFVTLITFYNLHCLGTTPIQAKCVLAWIRTHPPAQGSNEPNLLLHTSSVSLRAPLIESSRMRVFSARYRKGSRSAHTNQIPRDDEGNLQIGKVPRKAWHAPVFSTSWR